MLRPEAARRKLSPGETIMSAATRFTLAEFDRMIERDVFDSTRDRRIELIRGEIREVNPPGPTHETAVDRLTRWSTQNTSPSEVRVRIQNSIGAPEIDSAPQPDVAWVKERDYLQRRPQGDDVLLLIEVAESSLAIDRGEKAGLYAAAGIADYWIVNLCDLCIEVYRRPKKGQYREIHTYEIGDRVAPLSFPKAVLIVADLFAGFPSA